MYACACTHTRQPKCQENDSRHGEGAIRGHLLPRASAACSEAMGKQGRAGPVNCRRWGQTGDISAPLVGIPAAGTAACQVVSAARKRATCLCTHSIGVLFAQMPIGF